MKITAYDIAQRFVGIKEVKGSIDNPLIMAMLKLDATWPEHDEVPWCFSGDVEILTGNGFCRFDELKSESLVAQVDPVSLGVGLTKPLRIIRKRYNGEICKIDSRDFGLVCDSNHRFFGVWNEANSSIGGYELRPIKNLTSGLFIPKVSTFKQIDNNKWSDNDIKLLSAFLSDGFYHRGKIQVQVSKIRKIDFLHNLFPTNVYKAKKVYGQSTRPLTTFTFEIPEVFNDVFFDYKKPSYDFLWSLSGRQLKLLIAAYLNFDGYIRAGNNLYTSSEYLRDWLQVALSLAGYHSSYRRDTGSPYTGKGCYTITYSVKKKTRCIRSNSLSFDNQKFDLYCVRVPTGVIVIRDPKGTVIPVGNCSAFVNWSAWLLRLPRSKSLRARSWLEIGTPVQVENAEQGFDVVVLKRHEDDPGPDVLEFKGHVGFFSSIVASAFSYPSVDSMGNWNYSTANVQTTGINVLGGNQSNQVSVVEYPINRLLGIRRLYIE